jgi:hypothetical protein
VVARRQRVAQAPLPSCSHAAGDPRRSRPPPSPQRHIAEAHDYSQLERAHTNFLARLLNQSLLAMHSVRGSMSALLGSVIDLCRLAEEVAGEAPPGLRQVQDARARFEAAVGPAPARQTDRQTGATAACSDQRRAAGPALLHPASAALSS